MSVGHVADAECYCVAVHAAVGEGELLRIALHPTETSCKTCRVHMQSRNVGRAAFIMVANSFASIMF